MTKPNLLKTFAAASLISITLSSTAIMGAAAANPNADRKLEEAMDRITQTLDYAEKKIEGIKASTSENSLNSISKRIDRAQKLLQGVSPDTQDFVDQQNRIAELRQRLSNAVAAAKSAEKDRDAHRTALSALAEAGTTKADDQFVRDANTLASAIKFMDFEHSHLDREYSPKEEYSHYARHFPTTLERIKVLLETYGSMDPRDVREFSGPALSMLVQEGGPDFKLAEEKLSKFGEAAINRAETKLNLAYTTVDEAIKSGEPATILDNPAVFGSLHYFENVAFIYRSRPDADSSLLHKYAELEQIADTRVKARINDAMSEIVKNNKPVANKFADPDRATIENLVRARWADAYPSDKILQVRIPQQNWVRRQEPGWRDGYLIMFDYSITTPYVVVQEENKMASMWGMTAEKDHTLDGEISVSFGRLRTEQLDPRFTVLQSSLD